MNLRSVLGRLVIGLGCAYEIVALADDRVPTITAIVKRTGRNPIGRFLVWGWCGFVAWHFLEPEREIP